MDDMDLALTGWNNRTVEQEKEDRMGTAHPTCAWCEGVFGFVVAWLEGGGYIGGR